MNIIINGSTGVACLNTNRKFIGIELDEGYFKIANERIKQNQQELLLELIPYRNKDEVVSNKTDNK